MKKSYPEKFSVVIAIFLSFGFYMLLFALFQFRPRTAPSEDKPFRHLADVIMLPLEKDPIFPWQKNLIASLDLLDPTIMSLPHAVYGFSNIRNLEFERPVKPLTPYQMDVEFASPAPTSESIVTKPIDDLFSAMNSNNSFEPALSTDKQPSVVMDSVVYWTNDEGTVQEKLPAISLKEIAKDDKKLTTLGPTHLFVLYRGGFARIQLVNSCGNKQLDKVAINSLRRYYTKEQAKLTSNTSNSERKKEGIDIFAHWRFAEEIDESININGKDHHNDRDWL